MLPFLTAYPSSFGPVYKLVDNNKCNPNFTGNKESKDTTYKSQELAPQWEFD